MARPTKQVVDGFPSWKPYYRTEEKFYGSSKSSYKSLRSSSSSFTKNKTVRDLILKKCGNKCVSCGNRESLQIDHIITVYQAFINKKYIRILNTYENLQVLCSTCNSAKSADGEMNG